MVGKMTKSPDKKVKNANKLNGHPKHRTFALVSGEGGCLEGD